MFNLQEKLQPYKKIIDNFASLSVLQAANYLFPLIVLPYVVRVLGPEKYGLVQFAAALNIYFLILCDYGFNLSGTRAVSVHRKDKEKLSQIFSSILIIKTALFIVAILLLAAIVLSVEKFRADYLVYFASSGMLIGSVLFPLWLFQGLEKMKYITIINVIVRIFTTALIFLLIRSEDDYIKLAFLNSITQVLIGVAGIITALTILKVKLIFPPLKIIKDQLRDGWYLFLSSISINLYTTSNTFILGLLTNNTFVGYYAAADKIRIAFHGILNTISQSVFPFVNNLLRESFQKFINFNKKLIFFAGGIGLILTITLFLFASDITGLMLGEQYLQSADILRIISFVPFLVALSNVFGIQIMLPLGYDKVFNKIISAAAFIHIILLLTLIPEYFAIGTAVSVIITEFLVTLLMFIFLKHKKILLTG